MAEYISSGTVSDLLVNTDCYVTSGGVVKCPTVSGDGVLNLSDGGTAESAIVSSGNTYKGLYVFSGGTAINTSILNGGTVYLYEGGKASGGTVSSGGALNINANAYAWDLVVQPGANVTVLSGASVYAMKDNGGNVYIQEGAYVTFAPNIIDALAVNSTTYGVRSGTTLTHATVGNEGTITVYSGGRMESTTVNSCNAAQYKGLFVSNGGVAVDTDINNAGAVYVYSGGTVIGGTVSAGGYFYVNPMGIASNFIVQPGAYVTIMSGASVYAMKDNGGNVYIQEGAYVTFAPNIIDALAVNSTTYGVRSGTTLTHATVGNEGTITVYSGGRMESTTVNSCNAAQYKGLFVSNGGVAVDTDINNAGAVYVYSGGTVIGGTVSAGGYFYVNPMGVASNFIVQPGANVTIASGASVYNLKDDGGNVYIQEGAYVTFAPNVIDALVMNSGTYNVQSGTTLTHATVGANGQIIVRDGGVVDTTLVNSCNTAEYKGLFVSSGGKAINTDIKSGGALYVYGDGQASGCTVSAGAACYIEANGLASDFRVQSGANLIVRSGGTAYNILEDGGIVTVMDGAVVTFVDRIVSGTVLTDGPMTIHAGTIMENTVIGQNGKLSIIDGGRAEKTTVNACTPDGGLVLYNNAVATGNTMNDSGFTFIFSGGTAIDNTINSGGSMTLFSGAVMKNVDVMSGGKLYLSSGSLLTGRIRVDTLAGYIFIDDYGCTIDFDVSEIDPSGDVEALLDDFERIRPEPKDAPQKPDYTITVAPDQPIGTYKIAMARHNVEFPSITVKDTLGQTLGVLTETGKFTYNGAEYRLSYNLVIDTSLQQGVATLFLHIGDDTNGRGPSQPVVSADITTPTTSSVTVTATFDNTTVNKLYSYDAKNWMPYADGVSVSENCRVYFRGENGKGASGIACYTVNNIESVAPPTPTYIASGDIDGNGVSDVMFVWTGEHGEGNYQHGYWMNGTSEWQSVGAGHPSSWDNLGCHDMDGNGKADAVLFGNVDAYEVPSAYIGYYRDGVDSDENWVTIGFLTNAAGINWKNAIGNLTGNAGANSIVWYAPELNALGAWKDGAEDWVTLSSDFGGSEWTLAGCGDFDGDGRDSVLMTFNGGQLFYAVGIDEAPNSLGSANWAGWEVRAIGDFAGDGRDDLVLFHKDTGSMVMCADGNVDSFVSLAQLDPVDWFVAGCGDYDGDRKDDLLVRQYSSGMLGYYSSGDTSQWVELGRGVGMEWTVIA